jgi:hypothetical protein
VENPFWTQRLDGIVDDRVVEYVAEEIREDAGRFAPVGVTRRLKHSFIVVKPRELVRWIGSTLFYWRFAEKGTSAHGITAGSIGRSGTVSGTKPRAGSALAWPPAFRPFLRVRHPGGTAKPHLKRALFKKRALPRF